MDIIYEIVEGCDNFYQVQKEGRPITGKIASRDSAVNFIIKATKQNKMTKTPGLRPRHP
tara:strand:+ start:86 stop:262 length:177 start_codon:yes stop_codon:yes gene_type:complete